MLIHIMKDGSVRSDMNGCVIRKKELLILISKEKSNDRTTD